MEYLHDILSLLIVVSSVYVAISTNPIESVLFLILTFCCATGILFLFNVEFLGLIFLIVYVGAVAVLFLFVIMMLNVKFPENVNYNSFEKIFSTTDFYYFCFFIIYSIYLILVLFFREALCVDSDFVSLNLFGVINNFDNLNNIDVFGQVIYNYFLVCFLIAGLILLIALIGAISLTLRFNDSKRSQLVDRQLSRNDNFLSFFN